MPSFLELPRAANCESRSLVGTYDNKIIIIPLRCGSWGCIRCSARMTTIWSHRVAAADPERMVTFTRVGLNRHDIRIGLQTILRDLRKRNFEFEYWGVVELHQSGVPHMHVVQRGSYIPKSELSAACGRAGWGFSDIRKITTGWSAARYCAKHLCHSHGRRWDGRLIRYSRKFFEKDCGQGDLKEATKEMCFSPFFGRADELADKYRARGAEVEVGDMGIDWIMGEELLGNEVVQRYARNTKKGYGIDSDAYSEVSNKPNKLSKFSKETWAAKEVK